ncbi:tetrahydromethanopterin S-methyltransferase subunit A [Dechloromonas sp. ARDL1]|uniref:tetrahydromethanopterin S-methyltransferase subunit A n=1 Tax=Dechloromonas sp. ARDL1 TaxID=3322121 RepID=UPI003DA75AF0
MSARGLEAAEEQIRLAMAATKCHRCGCFQDTVQALEQSHPIRELLPELIKEALALFEPKRYECLGCEVCWPAVATNATAEIDPAIAEMAHCATADPEEREGWPPLPGDYRVVRYQAPVAVCTLNSDDLMPRLAGTQAPGLAIVGSLHTENLGIEHLIRNLLPNPHIRFLIVCGEDTQKAIGHLPGQSLVALMMNGLEDRGRISGAEGKRPVIKNVSLEQVEAFRRQVQVMDCIGMTDLEAIAGEIAKAAANDPGPATATFAHGNTIPVQQAQEPSRLVSDPAGYLVLYPDRRRKCLVLEHYANNGTLDRVVEGATPTALYSTFIAEGLISRLDHAAYLGRELARAETALREGHDYVQDRAPGEIESPAPEAKCGCSGACH